MLRQCLIPAWSKAERRVDAQQTRPIRWISLRIFCTRVYGDFWKKRQRRDKCHKRIDFDPPRTGTRLLFRFLALPHLAKVKIHFHSDYFQYGDIDSSQYETQYHSIIQSQSQIGWIHMFMGRYTNKCDTLSTNEHWMTAIVKATLQQVITLWCIK